MVARVPRVGSSRLVPAFRARRCSSSAACVGSSRAATSSPRTMPRSFSNFSAGKRRVEQHLRLQAHARLEVRRGHHHHEAGVEVGRCWRCCRPPRGRRRRTALPASWWSVPLKSRCSSMWLMPLVAKSSRDDPTPTTHVHARHRLRRVGQQHHAQAVLELQRLDVVGQGVEVGGLGAGAGGGQRRTTSQDDRSHRAPFTCSAAVTMPTKSSTFRLAPPMRPPSTSGSANSSAAFEALQLPP